MLTVAPTSRFAPRGCLFIQSGTKLFLSPRFLRPKHQKGAAVISPTHPALWRLPPARLVAACPPRITLSPPLQLAACLFAPARCVVVLPTTPPPHTLLSPSPRPTLSLPPPSQPAAIVRKALDLRGPTTQPFCPPPPPHKKRALPPAFDCHAPALFPRTCFHPPRCCSAAQPAAGRERDPSLLAPLLFNIFLFLRANQMTLNLEPSMTRTHAHANACATQGHQPPWMCFSAPFLLPPPPLLPRTTTISAVPRIGARSPRCVLQPPPPLREAEQIFERRRPRLAVIANSGPKRF